MRELVTQVLNVRISKNSLKNLRLPNMVSKGKKLAFQLFKDKMNSQIHCWNVRNLLQ